MYTVAGYEELKSARGSLLAINIELKGTDMQQHPLNFLI